VRVGGVRGEPADRFKWCYSVSTEGIRAGRLGGCPSGVWRHGHPWHTLRWQLGGDVRSARPASRALLPPRHRPTGSGARQRVAPPAGAGTRPEQHAGGRCSARPRLTSWWEPLGARAGWRVPLLGRFGHTQPAASAVRRLRTAPRRRTSTAPHVVTRGADGNPVVVAGKIGIEEGASATSSLGACHLKDLVKQSTAAMMQTILCGSATVPGVRRMMCHLDFQKYEQL